MLDRFFGGLLWRWLSDDLARAVESLDLDTLFTEQVNDAVFAEGVCSTDREEVAALRVLLQ